MPMQFIDKYGYGKPYVYIHPYKQHVVKAIADSIFPEIGQVVVFGSAVTNACKPYSDVDVCVIGNFDTEKVAQLRVKGEAIDILHFETVDHLRQDDRLVNEVRKGVQIYG